MNLSRGIWVVVTFFAVYSVLYWQYVILAELPVSSQFSYFFGSSAVICMVVSLLMAARPRAAETSFGGLDRMYKLHKYLGVSALILLLAHYATAPGGPDEEEGEGATAFVEGSVVAGALAQTEHSEASEEEEGVPIDLLGMMAMLGFTLLILITLNRKIPYHRWITTHRFMGLFFFIVCGHVFLVLYDGRDIPILSAPGMILLLLLVTGIAAYAYKQLFHPRKEKHPFTLASVRRLERATEVVLAPKNAMFPFEPGQFAFITIDAVGFREAHPFTISSGAQEDKLRFTMKVLGDYTRRVRDTLATGADVAIEGPYGRFNPLKGSVKQIWVAGGIGITPFLSVLRTMAPSHGKVIRLYYCVRTSKEALFFDELEKRAAELGEVTITRLDSDTGALISADRISQEIDSTLRDWSYYLCGPKPMTEAVSGGLTKQGVPARSIHTEEFEFR